MSHRPDISIVIATFNRAKILRETLEAMTHLDQDSLNVEFIIVDNNSSDRTKETIHSFSERLPIRYLSESKQGKNCALNLALRDVELGDLVVFTDDDVTPQDDWLQVIASVSRRRPDISVFGGRITLLWPDEDIPAWAQDPYIQEIAFSRHEPWDLEHPYEGARYPFGGNLWLRREIFDKGHRFNEQVGPRPKNRIMGSETALLKSLADADYQMIYSPQAVVRHRIRSDEITVDNVRRRSFRLGRQGPHVNGLCRTHLLQKHPGIWRLLRFASLVKGVLGYGYSMLSISPDRRLRRSLYPIQVIAYNLESLKIASGRDAR